MPGPDLWSRVKEARLVRVVLIYVGASWLILQVTNELRETLDLPHWVSPVALILLVIGLLVIVATAWVQAHPIGPRAQEGQETPGSWEIGLREIKQSVARGRLPHLTWARTLLGGLIAFSFLFGLAGLYVVIKDRGRSFAPTEAVAAPAGPGLAVLPFEVKGDGLEAWREGMVDLLTTNVDGVGGLRAIDSRTLLARWREEVPDGETPELATALDVARRAEARYALLGSAVAIGPRVRLVADVYDVAGGTKMGQAQAEGSPDSVLALVDGMTVDVLRVILPEHEGSISARTLASVTTTSIPALRAYLEGEALFRRSDFTGAIAAYERAVTADSTFALAAYRLGNSYGWSQNVNAEAGQQYLELALRHVGRLAEREALIVRGSAALQRGTLDGLEPLKEAVQRYPDDPDAWYQLGDTYEHLGDQAVMDPIAESDRALSKAVALDPGFAPGYVHLIDHAFYAGDSARAAELIETYHKLAPGSEWDRRYSLELSLAFGDSAARADAYETVASGPEPPRSAVYWDLSLPRLWPVQEEVARRIEARPDAPGYVAHFRFFTEANHGRLRAGLAALDDPRLEPAFVSGVAYWLARMGLTLPDERVARDLSVVPVEVPADLARVFYAGAYAADRGRWTDHAAAVNAAEEAAARWKAAGDSMSAARADGIATALRGYASWKQGRTDEALRLLEASRPAVVGHTWEQGPSPEIRRWIGELLVQQGELREAEPYFISLYPQFVPDAAYELGKLYLRLGEKEKARDALSFVAQAWQDADPELAPQVADARRGLESLAGESSR